MLPASIDELEKIRSSCKRMVRRRAAVSGGAVLVPVPGVDIAADVSMLLELIPAINRKFGLTPEQIEELDSKHKALVYGMLKKVGAELVGRAVTHRLILAALKKVGIRMATKQVLKYIPLAGQAAAAALSVAAMMYIGNSHIDQCFEIARGAIDD
jgi:uncharacterized protein (DUF697 family)